MGGDGIMKALKITGIVFLFIITFLLILIGTLYLGMRDICSSAVSSRNTIITTILETGQFKFLASWCLSEEEIEEVVKSNSMAMPSDEKLDTSLIKISSVSDQGADIHGTDISSSVKDNESGKQVEKDIEIIPVPGLTFQGTMMIIKDPSRLSVATIYDEKDGWPSLGVPLKDIVEMDGAIGGINGGLYNSKNNCGKNPYGVCISRGEIVRNKPTEYPNLVFVGLTEDNILQIIDINGKTQKEIVEMKETLKLRDGVCFQDVAYTDNNHFVTLIINGVPREMNGKGSGLNPRTAIGQRADGALLLLVTDGRGYNNHIGASAGDLIDIMMKFGAVNAANLDGGSSTCMYYNGEYLQNSVTLIYSQTSWRLPCAFVIH